MKGWLYIILVGITVGLILGGALPTVAQAHTDYRPWKHAMYNWFQDYADFRWQPAFDAACENGTYVEDLAVVETPPAGQMSCNYDVNAWGWRAQDFAMFITAIDGEFPNTLFTKELRDILRPYLPGTYVDRYPDPYMTRRAAKR